MGEWQTTGTHPYLPGTVLRGHASFEWLENGAFLIMRSELDNRDFPDGLAIFGADDAAKTYFILYFDERGVSRKYDVIHAGNQFTWSRDDAKLSQLMTFTIDDDGRTMTGKGEMSRDGHAWEDDLASHYERVK